VALEKFISPGEVAKQLKVHKNTVYRLLRAEEVKPGTGIKGVRVGALWRINPEAVREYLSRGSE